MSTQPKPWKLETPHIAGCMAVASGAPFQTLVEPAHTLFCNYAANPKARHGAHYLYVRVRCNDPRCPATALFNLNAALVAIGLNNAR